MNEIILRENDNIRITQMDKLTTNTSFYHVDRIASMNVMIYVIEGSIYVTEDETDYAVNPGEILFLKKGTHQYGRKLIREGTSWIYAHFQIDQPLKGDEIIKGEQQKLITLPKQIDLRAHIDIQKCLTELYSTYYADKIMSHKRASLGLHKFLLDIEELSNARKANSLVADIDQFIKSNIRKDLSGKDFTQEFHVTYKYLNRVYKGFYGQSIMQVHFDKRMKLASSELCTNNSSINSISEALGFSDPLYFSKCFKKYTGISPREYRKIAVQNF